MYQCRFLSKSVIIVILEQIQFNQDKIFSDLWTLGVWRGGANAAEGEARGVLLSGAEKVCSLLEIS